MRLFFLPDKLLHILISTSPAKRFLILGGMGAGILLIPIAVFASLSLRSASSEFVQTSSGESGLAVLAAQTENPNFIFNVNVPSFFSDDVTIEGGLTVKGKAVFSEGVDLSGNDIDLGEGELTASNVIYSITAGDGLTVTDGQTPTITNTGVTSFQGKSGKLSLEAGSGISIDGLKITASVTSNQDTFKTIAVSGQEDVVADSSTDTLTFAAGSGIVLTTDPDTKELTIAATGGGGGSGLTSLDGLDGTVTIANTTGSGSIITIDDASTSQKGIAQFSSTDFSVTSGLVSLVQSIATSASPSFVGMTLSGLTTNGGLLYTNGSGVISQLGVGTDGYVLTSNGSGAPSWEELTSSQWDTIGLNINYAGGNVGIGTTTPGQKLDVNGNIRSSDGTFVAQIKGDSGGPRIQFGDTSDPASMLSFGAYNSVNNIDTTTRNLRIFSTSDTTGLTYLASSGNFGIGTTSPTGKMNVVGATGTSDLLRIQSSDDSTSNYFLNLLSSNGTRIAWLRQLTSTTANLNIRHLDGVAPGGNSGGDLYLNYTSSGNVSIANGGGNVGIGTISPVGKLNLTGSVTGKALAIFNQTGDQDIFAASSSGTTKFVINNAGNVGIGTSNPGFPLQVSGNANVTGTLQVGTDSNKGIISYASNTLSFNSAGAATMFVSGSTLTLGQSGQSFAASIGINNQGSGTNYNAGDFTIISGRGTGSGTAGNILFQTANVLASGTTAQSLTTKVIFQANGNVGVGTTAPTGLLHLSGGTQGGNALAIFDQTGASTNDILAASSSGTTKFRINNSGQVYMADGSAPGVTTNMLYAASGNLYWNGAQVSTGSSSQWTTSSSDIYYNTGNVAIGTTSSSSRLDLKSSATNTDVQRWMAFDGSRLARLTETSGGAGWFEVDNASGVAQALLRGDGGDSYLLSGNFGIGTSTPGSKLDVISAGTTTNGLSLTANSLTTGYGAYFSSTSTALSTGSLMGLDWSPGSATTATGDLLSLNVGSNGSLGNIFNVKNGGSSVFSVSQTAVTANLPVNFTSPGDVSFAYDLVFTNPTASYITSAAPLYLRSGEVFNSSDLTLATYNKGNVIVDSEAFTARSATSSGQLVVGTSTAPANIGGLYITNGSTFGKSLAILNQTESADIFAASNSGTTRFVIAASGNIGINTTSTANPITVGTDNTNGNGANLSAGGSWNNGSSREFKENINTVDYGDVLSKINQLNISEWNYTNEQDSVKHIGPIAEDFYSLFGVGNDNKHISTIDPAGIALAGIKALSKEVEELRMQTLGASLSAHFATSESLGLTEDNATISGELTVLRRATVSDLGVTGKIVSGLMSIDGSNGEISIVGDLKLQANGFGKVDLFAGKMTVDNQGNIITVGKVTAKSVETEAVNVLGSSTGKDDTIGDGIVKSGSTSIVVSTGAVKNTSKIFVTPRSKTGNRQLIVTQVVNGTSFKVEIENAYTSDISFDWWVIN